MNQKIALLIVLFGIVLLAGCVQQLSQKDRPINQIPNNKFCNTDDNCGLLLCSGCFSKEFLKTAPPDPPCMRFEGYHCECNENKCEEIK